jgi:glycosyltransferase involved in cell wall biosynthesis
VGGGGASRTWALIAHLRAAGYLVELVTGDQGAHNDALAAQVDRLWIEHRAQAPSGPAGARAQIQAAYRRFDPELALPRHLFRTLTGKTPGEENLLKRNRRPRLERFAGEVAYANPPFAAIASYAWLAPVLDHMPPGTLRILDTIDIQHVRRERAAAAGGDLAHVVCSRDEECRELRRADVLLAIQAEEAASLEAMCPEREVLLVEHAMPQPTVAPSRMDSKTVLYVGNRYDPNVRGLEWMLRTVWPQVRAAVPDAELCVCGRVCEAVRGHHAQVRLEGLVPDLADYYHHAAVVVNPVPYGTGLKIKTVEALMHGRAMVCTEAGLGGLGMAATVPVRVSDDANGMARNIITLLQDVEARHELEAQALAYARHRFAPEPVYEAFLARLRRHGARSAG